MRLILRFGFALLLSSATLTFAQTAKDDIKKAGQDVKEAGKATGEAAKHTGKATAKTAKTAGKPALRNTPRCKVGAAISPKMQPRTKNQKAALALRGRLMRSMTGRTRVTVRIRDRYLHLRLKRYRVLVLLWLSTRRTPTLQNRAVHPELM